MSFNKTIPWWFSCLFTFRDMQKWISSCLLFPFFSFWLLLNTFSPHRSRLLVKKYSSYYILTGFFSKKLIIATATTIYATIISTNWVSTGRGSELCGHKMSKTDRPCPPVAFSLVQEGGIHQQITQVYN